MASSIIIATFFSIGFFFESIFGFGGGLIAYSFLGFFIDIKKMIIAGLYVGTLASAYIAFSSFKHFDKKIFIKLVPFSVIGSIIGTYIFIIFSPQILAVFFSIILFILSIRILFFDKHKIPKIIKNKFLFIGAVAQGSFGVGGPFIVSAISQDFANKSSLRSTMAMFFLFVNILRFFQLIFVNSPDIIFIKEIWWIIIPVFFAIYLGHFVHIKISDKYFKIGIATITLLASINFILKAIK
jgi:hypothetical protein